jgi:prepilin-type N-terminal cleavage/methylation domain-containing protein
MTKTVNHRGFTLLELLIVIIILGLLSGVAVPHYLDMQKEAKIAATKGRLAAIRGSIELAHAKILISGINTGIDGDNPDWPTLEEIQRTELFLPTRPESLQHLRLIRSEIFSNEQNKSLPKCNLPELTPGMAQNPSAVSYRTLDEATAAIRKANEATCWAYYPGDSLDANGRAVGAIFYLNDDRPNSGNIDAADQQPSMW